MSFRPITIEGFNAPTAELNPGAAPMLQWIAVGDLVVDERYQRPIYGAGTRNVKAIAGEFRWSKFAPLIVAPVAGGKFAIIDGQHRATAAALHGIHSLPAQVIIADEGEQAAAFSAINGKVTRIHKLAVQHAALLAGDKAALAIKAACDAAGVKILRYPVALTGLKPGETLALGTITECLKLYGREVVITALYCVTETENNKPGVLSATNIKALCATLNGNARWREGGEQLLTAFDTIDIEHELGEAKVTRRAKGTAVWEVLADRLGQILPGKMAGGEE